MSNTGQFYDHTTYPQTGAAGSSAALRAELDAIEAGFNKLPTLTGNGNKLVKISAGATDLETSSAFSESGSDGTVAGNLTVSGGSIGANNTQRHALPAVTADTIALLNATQTLTNKTVNLANNTLTGTLAQFNTALSDADFASVATAQTLTNKTIALANNTVSGTLAQFNTALSDDDFAGLAATQTLTNKTINLTSNTLSGTKAQFNAALSDGEFLFTGDVATPSASSVTATPSGNLSSGNVQDQLYELDSEKGGLSLNNSWSGNNVFNGQVTLGDAGTDTLTLNAQMSAGGGVGSADQVLTSRGANLAPTWSDQASVPVGSIVAFSGSSIPTGYLQLPTSTTNVSRTTYSALFAVIGTTYGAGDGSTTFGLPVVPADYALVRANGNLGTSTVGEVIAHTHVTPNSDGNANAQSGVTGVATNTNGVTGSTGGTANLAAGLRINYLIKF